MFGHLQQPTVLVLGLGISGLAMARWCTRHGCPLRIADTRSRPPNLQKLAALNIKADFVAGAFTPALLEGGIELVAISPGLSPFGTQCAPLIAAARKQGVPLWGEVEFFAQALYALSKQGYAPKVLAITGTNGKTTTTALTGYLCKRAGIKVIVAGNIHPAVLDTLADAMDNAALPDVWVLEVSSFQLETAHTFAPSAAAVLNITADHLDWHCGFNAYQTAKGRIFGTHTIRVLNRDDACAMSFAQQNSAAAPVVTFGLQPAEYDGDYGLLCANGETWLAVAERRTERLPTNRGEQTPARPARKGLRPPKSKHKHLTMKRLIPVQALRIRGLHNMANAMAALALVRSIDLPLASLSLLQSLCEYQGELHRLEWIATINGVDYVDDSKATNVGATLAALNGLAKRVVLILGGDGKGQDFAPLIAPIARGCRAVMFIGREAKRIRTTLAVADVRLEDHATLEAATYAAAAAALPGEAVLLSPACASFDMFQDYIHRAEVFRGVVQDLAARNTRTGTEQSAIVRNGRDKGNPPIGKCSSSNVGVIL